VDGLSAEREALWARLNAATFLTANEKRAAVGYAPADTSSAGDVGVKYSPDQPRAPEGNPDGGQWTDGGGGSGGGSSSDAGAESSGRIRLAQAEEWPSHRIDLRDHEGRNGGHAIAEHVGRSERGPALVRRRVGSFPSIEAANKLVSATLSRSKIQPGETLSNRELVGRVARGETNGAFITLEFDSKTGREAYAASAVSEPFLRDTYGVAVAIVHDENATNGFTVLSAYPRNP